MTQNTLVIKVPKARHADLAKQIDAHDWEYRQVPHAVFSVKGAGFVATLYGSGKFVIQGSDPQFFVARFTDLEVPGGTDAPGGDSKASSREEREAQDSIARLDVVTIGSDETGKGDFFGPLVVAAVLLEPQQAAELKDWGVADSKKLTDTRALKLGALLRDNVEYSIVRLDPARYNAVYPEYQSLNPLLADLHAEAIKELARPGVRVLVDQFANEKVMLKALGGIDVKLEQAPRAERNIAVAAASVIARQEFLVCMAELESEYDVQLHKGAGPPVDVDGVNFVRQHGEDALGHVGKLHFKNRQKILDQMRY